MNEKFYNDSCGCGRNARESFFGQRGSIQERENLMRQIQEAGFAMVEAALFLDTHPQCEEAQMAFSEFQMKYKAAVEEYELSYGPLTYSGVNVELNGWSWINDPWPWEVEDC